MGRLSSEMHNTLAEARKAAGLTQGDLAQAADVSRQTISSIEQGDYNPSTSLALRLSLLLGIPVEGLFSLPEGVQAELVRRRSQIQTEGKEDSHHADDLISS